MRLDRHMRIEPRDRARGAFDLRRTDVVGRMDDLPLQIRQRHRIVVDHAERPDAGRRQIHQRRRAEPARADHQNARALERRLTGPADLAQHDVARVALQFFRGQHGCVVSSFG